MDKEIKKHFEAIQEWANADTENRSVIIMASEPEGDLVDDNMLMMVMNEGTIVNLSKMLHLYIKDKRNANITKAFYSLECLELIGHIMKKHYKKTKNKPVKVL